MNENDAHICLDYNRPKQDSKNYKNEWEIRGTDITHTEKATDITHTKKVTDITLSHPVRTDYAENPEIVLQKTEKQREKLTGSSSDSSSGRTSLSQLFSFSVLLVFLQCISLSTVL